jgi:hypothetical protein
MGILSCWFPYWTRINCLLSPSLLLLLQSIVNQNIQFTPTFVFESKPANSSTMHMLSVAIITLVGTASATASAGQRSSFNALKGIIERQTQICTPVPAPATCEASCGPGNVECVSFPNCYNPGAGESCCSDGSQSPPRRRLVSSG